MINMAKKNQNNTINIIGAILMMKISVQKIFLICFLVAILFFKMKMDNKIFFIITVHNIEIKMVKEEGHRSISNKDKEIII